ncbi:MAG TPA: hypothetical protein VFP40_10945 [Terriglobales bacterium]|nr:hypothetical protein [Terriglobales bacterium]
MKTLLFVLLALLLAGAPQAIAADKTPLPAGSYSLTAQGTEASCTVTPCIVLDIIETGAMNHDKDGNACGSHSAVVNTVPPGSSAPIVVPSVITVLKVANYDAATGTGDYSLSEYAGGSCDGATFNSAGSTLVVTGTLHFTVSDNGRAIDSIVTALNLPGLGGYSIKFREVRQ